MKFITALLLGLFMAVIPAMADESGLFPTVPGWKIREDKKVYTGSDLWQFIDGAANIFLNYEFKDLHIAEYSSKNQIIRVEIYRHANADNSYGIYSAERMPDYPQVVIGSQGYKSQGVLNFLTGVYYVKVMTAGEEEAPEGAIARVAFSVNETLGQPVGLPEGLKYLPSEGMETLSDSYIARNFLGYSFFHSAFTAKYKTSTDFQVFVICSIPEAVQQMLTEYRKIMKDEKIRMEGDLMIASDPFNGTIFMQSSQGFLVGVTNTDNADLARDYIGKAMRRITR